MFGIASVATSDKNCKLRCKWRYAVADGAETTAPRIDLASVEAEGKDVRLVFWEAKAHSNGELRALSDGVAPACGQVETYRLALA